MLPGNVGDYFVATYSDDPASTSSGEDEEEDALDAFSWASAEEKTDIGKCVRDLTFRAHKGQLDPIHLSESLFERLAGLLSIEEGISLLLVGPSGAGKTAIMQGLAQRIAEGDCPDELQHRHVLQTSVDELYGASCDASNPWAKERQLLRQLFEDARRYRHILFYDDFQTIQEYTLSAPYIRQELRRGGVFFVAAIQLEHYYHFSQRHRSMLESFLRVDITPPSAQETVEMLGRRLRRAKRYRPARDEADVLQRLVVQSAGLIQYSAEPGRSLRILENVLFQKTLQGGEFQVTARDVQESICGLVRIPLKMVESATDMLLGMETFLKSRILGQEDAVRQICRRLIVTKSRCTVDPARPDGVFLFVGPTGVGKTEMARALAEYFTGNPDNMVRLDMSLYSDPSTSRTLLGDPGGRTRADNVLEMPELTRSMLDRPYTVLLLDEMEKAHSSIRLLFLNAIDTGKMQDNLGNTIYLSNAIIVMTSNVGYSKKRAIIAHPGQDADAARIREQKAVEQALVQDFPPEFLARIDEIVHFRQLTPAVMRGFISQKITQLERAVEKRIELNKAARDFLFKEGFSVEYGARQLNQAVDRLLGYPMALFRTRNSASWDVQRKISIGLSPEGDGLQIQNPE